MNNSTTPVQYHGSEHLGLRKNQESGPVAISFRLLLVMYGVIPIALLVILVDFLVLNSRLRTSFPHSPYEWWLVTTLFNYPHIFASQFSLFDREYLPHYRRLIRGIPIVVLCALLLATFIDPVGLLIFELITIYHVIFQQVGITRLMMGKANAWFDGWKWPFLSAFAFAYGGLALDASFPYFAITVGPLLLPTTYLAYKAAQGSQSGIGKHYLWANQTMLLFVSASYLRYPVFSVLIPRIIHDISAFAFYIAHDHNRNRREVKNGLYRFLSIVPVPVGFMGPLFGLTLNLLLRSYTRLPSNPFFYAPVNMIHYYTERVIWRRQNIHRQSLSFRP